ncbi:protein-export chaperone SecB [Blautia schinkii]|nr:protein-export chaperone SecB [Blautia schinkii]
MRPSKFQFVSPYLKEVHFELNPQFDVADKQFEVQNSFNVQVKRSEKENRANVELLLETNIEEKNAPFTLRIKVASDFKWDDLDEKTVESMLNFNAPALLLGYMRPIVANITNSSNMPAYNIPFISFKG